LECKSCCEREISAIAQVGAQCVVGAEIEHGMSADNQEGLRARLRPRARIMRTLGDELISSEVVAVIELVKNAYDADATRVLVRFGRPLEAGSGGIDIIDDGHGMSTAIVEQAWLEPATPYRRRDRRSESLQRQVLGEKGIGRFAVSRLADELELVTRRIGSDIETSVLFDWSLFDDDDAYLEDIEFVLEQGVPTEITAGGAMDALWPDGNAQGGHLEHGTLLRMSRLRTPWNEDRFADLRNGLSRLVSPFLFEEQRAREDAFVIELEVPAFPHLSGVVEPPETIRNPHYRMHAKVEADASFTATVRLRGIPEEVTKTGVLRGYTERAPESGAFEVELRVWDRDSTSVAELAGQGHTSSAQVRRDLNDAAGVSVYRDGFRVQPYGQTGNDWLSLDARRVNNPTLRLSNNQVVGYVLISRETNPELRDQSNREGLIDNQALTDLRDELRKVIAQLESDRYGVRPREEPQRPPRPGGLFAKFDLAAVRAHVNERYPADARLGELLGEAQDNLDDGVERAQEIVSRYRRLATLGELIDKVLHDGRAPLGKIGNEATLALRDVERDEIPCENMVMSLQRRFTRVLQQRDVLAAVFKRIEPFGGRRRGRPAPQELEQIVADSVGVLDGEIRSDGVTIELPESHTTVTADETELQQVFVNLLRNSLYWLREVPEQDRRIRISISGDDDGLHILFSDSGPGVDEAVRDRIFDPYFSTADNGVGLGLSIAGEIVEEYYDGRLSLLDDGPLPGANFQVTLRRRV
jgi:signal transduction histidine kinase